ncbi:MAG TPA: hypothetical protein VF861_01190 [Telluria sp.]
MTGFTDGLARGALLSALAALSLSAAARNTPAENSVEAVLEHIQARDCKGAVDALKAGLANNHPEVALLAGSMYDNGICVRRDWQRAATFYILADQGGQKAAVQRLIAGYAAPENGPDTAAALWWASREGQPAAPCGVSAKAAQDPDRFVAELGAWPQQRLAQCNYVVGVMATMAGELRYPDRPFDFSMGGEVEVLFLPAVPRVDLKIGASTEHRPLGLIDGDALVHGRSKATRNQFGDEVRKVADRALKRYPQPPGIPADTTASMRLIFTITSR